MTLRLVDKWDKVFKKSDKVNHKKVSFKNHFGIEIAADLYIPKEKSKKLPAIAISGPYGAVKEQSSGLYAQTLAERGFLTLAFDPSFTGESGGETRYMTSPDLNVEDFQASVDYLSNLEEVDPTKIAIIGICGWGGMALQTACLETRIKAVIASTMYDMTRVAGNGYFDADNNKEARKNTRIAINNQRTEDYKNGEYKLAGGVVDPVPDTAPQFLKDYHAYYKTPRGYHERSLNSNGGWAAQTNGSLLNNRILYYANEIDIPTLIIHGEKAHSRYNSETAFDMITGETKTEDAVPRPYTGVYPVGSTKIDNKELYIVEGASHVDLYDNLSKIPFERIESFLNESFEN